MQHTPGEWITVPLQYGIAIKERSIHERGFSDHIADVDGLGTTQQADAKLIAAAPDMLAILQDVLATQSLITKYTHHAPELVTDEITSTFNRVKQAIQKATQ